MRAANGVAMRAMCCERIVGAFLGAEVRSGERACVCATGACEREYASIATTTLFAAQPPSILCPRTTPENSEKVDRHKRDAARIPVGRPQRGSRPRARRAPRSLPPVFTWRLSHPTPASCWSPRPKLPWRRPPWSTWSGIDHNQVAVLRVHGRADPVLHLGRSTHGYGRR